MFMRGSVGSGWELRGCGCGGVRRGGEARGAGGEEGRQRFSARWVAPAQLQVKMCQGCQQNVSGTGSAETRDCTF